MEPITIILIAVIALSGGIVSGYYARQSIVKRRAGTIEQKLQKKIDESKEKQKSIIETAEKKAKNILEKAEKEQERKRKELSETQQLLLKRENLLDKKISVFKKRRKENQEETERIKKIKEEINNLKEKAEKELESISGLSQEKAKKELFSRIEEKYQQEILEKIRNIEEEGVKRYEKKAKEILALAIEKCAVDQSHELTTSTVLLESEEFKGRVIGKEGRNIRAFEKLTGVELIVDESPEAVVISGFNPIRREIAKIALQKLIQDGRIQPARIEKEVKDAEEKIIEKTKEAGEKAIYETGITRPSEKCIEILGRLYYRTSYGQNVLMHSMEVALLAEALAEEIGVDSRIAKRAGLFHDIGKAVDHQVKGSHVDIGIRILEKFEEDERVIQAMKSHHEEYPAETIEAIIVTTADAISGSRPGARKDTLENYLQRLTELEEVASSFSEIEKAYAVQAGREIRVFVRPDKVTDVKMQIVARQVADKIEEELKYPGEIKVIVIRENRVTEYAR